MVKKLSDSHTGRVKNEFHLRIQQQGSRVSRDKTKFYPATHRKGKKMRRNDYEN